jgi:hypothetical protein
MRGYGSVAEQQSGHARAGDSLSMKAEALTLLGLQGIRRAADQSAMELDAVCGGMAFCGVGIAGPLVRLHADEAGGHLLPRWRWLGWLQFRDYRWSWSDVNGSTCCEVRSAEFTAYG